MARSLNTRGREELAALRKRVQRQYALDRIERPDHDNLMDLIDLLDSAIVRTNEKDQPGKESLFSV